jgi:hypothetical protein
MKCPKKRIDCKPSAQKLTKDKKQWICSGKSDRPKCYKKDIVAICCKGRFSEFNIQMTVAEAFDFVMALCARLSDEFDV